jgi:hypothetical protein
MQWNNNSEGYGLVKPFETSATFRESDGTHFLSSGQKVDIV